MHQQTHPSLTHIMHTSHITSLLIQAGVWYSFEKKPVPDFVAIVWRSCKPGLVRERQHKENAFVLLSCSLSQIHQ